ncbi:type VII toxin-antitoxin system HepT family RNase toxin [Marinicellulosiphila megalodicopiae]|uniref:type VII toxin-antitoxin system HepT family RNase toxin n=1 Tax=Marinicellulosiphila megalodicopiae TaxID=2724896 RepID=UPI003BB078BD
MQKDKSNIDGVLLNKSATIVRCLKRINEEFCDSEEFKMNFTKQDSVVLNLHRVCEASIDMANRYIRLHKLELVQSARDAFVILHKNHIIDQVLSENLQKMVGLRNIAVHDYQSLNIEIVKSIVNKHLVDFENFNQVMLSA